MRKVTAASGHDFGNLLNIKKEVREVTVVGKGRKGGREGVCVCARRGEQNEEKEKQLRRVSDRVSGERMKIKCGSIRQNSLNNV